MTSIEETVIPTGLDDIYAAEREYEHHLLPAISKRDELKYLKKQRNEAIDLRIEQLERAINASKERLRDYIVNVRGGDGFELPGLARLHVQRRKVAPFVVTDQSEFGAWAVEAGYTKTVPDTTKAIKEAADLGLLPPGAEPSVEKERVSLVVTSLEFEDVPF